MVVGVTHQKQLFKIRELFESEDRSLDDIFGSVITTHRV